jgi:hypothetical protein
VNLIIDQGIAAALTRPAFRTAAAAAGWAHAKPEEFCACLDGAVPRERRAESLEVFEECRPAAQSTNRPPVGAASREGRAAGDSGVRSAPRRAGAGCSCRMPGAEP